MENTFLTDAELPATVADIKSLQSKIADIPAGPAGPAGQSGAIIQKFGNSLVKNGSFEFGNLSGWGPITNQALILENDGNKIALFGESVIENDDEFIVDASHIYKISATITVIGTGGTTGLLLKSGTFLVGSNSYTNEGTYKKVSYFAGVGVNKFPYATCKAKLVLSSSASVTSSTFSKIVVEKVNLGEPVPFNLPFLPVGQMVFDSTDGSVGRYDGSSIQWFAMS